MSKIKDLKNEEWHIVKLPKPNARKLYYFSNRGRLKSVDRKSKKEQLRTLNKDNRGHLRASITDGNSKNYAFYIHKHLAKKYVKQPSKHHTLIVHKNYKREDNKIKNLVWVTKEEHQDYVQKRLKALGYEYHRGISNSKLKEKQVAMIKKMLNVGKATKTKIAMKYGVSITQINRIQSGENWSHVEAKK